MTGWCDECGYLFYNYEDPKETTCYMCRVQENRKAVILRLKKEWREEYENENSKKV